jgi:hypothetical protein
VPARHRVRRHAVPREIRCAYLRHLACVASGSEKPSALTPVPLLRTPVLRPFPLRHQLRPISHLACQVRSAMHGQAHAGCDDTCHSMPCATSHASCRARSRAAVPLDQTGCGFSAQAE